MGSPGWLKPVTFSALAVVTDLGKMWEPVDKDICSLEWWWGGEDVRAGLLR